MEWDSASVSQRAGLLFSNPATSRVTDLVPECLVQQLEVVCDAGQIFLLQKCLIYIPGPLSHFDFIKKILTNVLIDPWWAGLPLSRTTAPRLQHLALVILSISLLSPFWITSTPMGTPFRKLASHFPDP